MRRLLYIFSIAILYFSCEDVIEIDTPTEPPRLSIDALIRVLDSSETTEIKVSANLSSSFFGNLTPVDLDEITITNLTPPTQTITLTEQTPNSGIYVQTVNSDFLKNGNLLLEIEYEGETYNSETQFVPTVPLTSLEQGTETLFSGDETEIIITYDDEPNREDFYIFDFDFDEYLVSEDTFYQGQQFEFSYFYDNNISPGIQVNVSILGADEPFYNYMNQLIVQAGGDQGPFQTPAATVRGNIVNNTNPDNFPLGYFAVVQQFTSSVIIE